MTKIVLQRPEGDVWSHERHKQWKGSRFAKFVQKLVLLAMNRYRHFLQSIASLSCHHLSSYMTL